MTILIERFRETVKKNYKDIRMTKEAEPDVGYSTGFLGFDFRNGSVVHVKSETENYKYLSIGISDGCLVMIIGRSGCGKTTFAVQAASNIIRPFKTSTIFHDDIESGITTSRRENLSKFFSANLKERYLIRNTGITAENFYERLKIIHDLKINNTDDFAYETGYLDNEGQMIIKLEPTVYILDSLALLMPEKFTEEEEMSGQMSSTAAAKMNSMLFKRIVPMLKIANIILFVINHVTDNVDIGVVKKRSELGYMKQSDRVSGGKTPKYVTNVMLQFEDKSKLEIGKDLDIDGFFVEVTFLKSRTNKAGKTVTLVYSQENGFDKELSLLILLKQADKLTQGGAYFKLGDTDFKFRQKDFKSKLASDEEFRNAFSQEVISLLTSEINYDDSSEYKEEDDVSINILSNIMKLRY